MVEIRDPFSPTHPVLCTGVFFVFPHGRGVDTHLRV